eukprot:TCONS_00042313-protein
MTRIKPVKWHRRSMMYLGVELMIDDIKNGEGWEDLTDEQKFWLLFDRIDFALLNKLSLETHLYKDQYSSKQDLLEDKGFIGCMKSIFYQRDVETKSQLFFHYYRIYLNYLKLNELDELLKSKKIYHSC